MSCRLSGSCDSESGLISTGNSLLFFFFSPNLSFSNDETQHEKMFLVLLDGLCHVHSFGPLLRHPSGHAYFDPNDFLEGMQPDMEREELEYEVRHWH